MGPDVSLVTSGPVTLRSPMAVTHFADSSLKEADLTVYAELHNATDKAVSRNVTGTVANVPYRAACGARATRRHDGCLYAGDSSRSCKSAIRMSGGLSQMGEPHLETLTLRFLRRWQGLGRADRAASESAK